MSVNVRFALKSRSSCVSAFEKFKKLQKKGLKVSGRKAQLVLRLAEAERSAESPTSQPVDSSSNADKDAPPTPTQTESNTCSSRAVNPVILVLGETLQNLPIESIPLLRDHGCVSRMPSLAHLFLRVSFRFS